MTPKFHPLPTNTAAPERFTYPFNYEPHLLCRLAATLLQQHAGSVAEWAGDLSRGKMLGVLVVSGDSGRRGFLAAYSGLLAGRNDWPYFVPPVFDSQQPDGYFKQHEREISRINAAIAQAEADPQYAAARQGLSEQRAAAEREINDYRELMQRSKMEREARRNSPRPLSADEEQRLVRESQFQKAEFRRLKQRLKEQVSAEEEKVAAAEGAIRAMKKERKEKSDALQRWLFSNYTMLNARGESRPLTDIFASTPGGIPPSGAGDCCAPKLLQYAYQNGLRPLCMAEFWWGASPKTEIRHHLHFYPACRSKCKPILGWMLQGLSVDPDPHDEEQEAMPLRVVFEDQWLVVVSKPSGMLSVPGLVDRRSVVESLREMMGEEPFLEPAHRLDMDTSGLLIIAKSPQVLRRLHAMFAARQVEKRYVALLDGIARCPRRGTISLPLAPDPHDSPRQLVDPSHGKPALTDYEIQSADSRHTLVRLFPHTGRTHQLRVHCAHAEGLGLPILGDRLYGHPSSSRLCLHAEALTLRHPVTGEWLHLLDRAPFSL